MTLEQFLCAILARAAATNPHFHSFSPTQVTMMAELWDFAMFDYVRYPEALYVDLNEPISDEWFNANRGRIRFY